MSARAPALALLCAAACALASAGCYHHQAHLPGVIDMRTDGSGLPPPARAPAPNARVSRPGSSGLAEGQGVWVTGNEVDVEDRHYWLLGAVPIYNESPRPELEGALALSGALTQVEVGEEIDVIDVIFTECAPSIFPVAAWIVPPYTFRAHARLATWPPPAVSPPVPPPVSPPAPPPAVSPPVVSPPSAIQEPP